MPTGNKNVKHFVCSNVHENINMELLYLADGRPQWPRGLRHELSSPVQTLGSWVRIPHEAWMSL
jgi:hypothetical protein